MSSQSGFTLTELLLSIAIIGILAGLSMPFYQSFLQQSDLSNATTTTANAYRRAVAYAQAVKGDSKWGVYAQANSIIVFKGASYATRDTTADEDFNLPASISASGLNEVTFDKVSGNPSITGTLTLTNTTNNTRAITLNAKGLTSY